MVVIIVSNYLQAFVSLVKSKRNLFCAEFGGRLEDGPWAIVFRCLSGTAGQQPPVVASDGMPRGREGNSGAAGGRVGGRVSAAGGDEVGATLEVESHIGRCGLTQDCIGQWTAASHAEKTSARLCCNRVLTVDTHTPQRKLCRLVDI